MQYRTNLGRFASSYWHSLGLEKKVILVFILTMWSLPFMTVIWGKIAPRTLEYVAAPRVYADMVKTPHEVLEAIAACESGNGQKGSGKQFYEDGRVVLNVNKGGGYKGSPDVGKWQINTTIHGAQIARMGLNVVTSEEDNQKFAEYLYEKNGTADWGASKHCWSKLLD